MAHVPWFSHLNTCLWWFCVGPFSDDLCIENGLMPIDSRVHHMHIKSTLPFEVGQPELPITWFVQSITEYNTQTKPATIGLLQEISIFNVFYNCAGLPFTFLCLSLIMALCRMFFAEIYASSSPPQKLHWGCCIFVVRSSIYPQKGMTPSAGFVMTVVVGQGCKFL